MRIITMTIRINAMIPKIIPKTITPTFILFVSSCSDFFSDSSYFSESSSEEEFDVESEEEFG